MKVNCQYTVPCSDDPLGWTSADPSRSADILIPQEDHLLLPSVSCLWPNYFFMQIFFPLILCFFEVINLNFSNINTMHLMTTIQILIFMAGAKWKKCPASFAIENKNPSNTIPFWAQTKHTSNRGIADAYLKRA